MLTLTSDSGTVRFTCKEYEIVVAKSAALGHTSHYSHRPENRLKNRYLNITAYDHSRVCVSSGGRCGAPGCVGGAGAGGCDYVNANFIDGMLPALDEQRIKYIKKKLERRNKPQRQPSVKPIKPPPNLTEGIESAFLNIEFSGIVEWERDGDCSSEEDDDPELDDVVIDIEGQPTQIKLEWVVWRRRYIATQGPTPPTLASFWRMVWQHRARTLVCITNLVERGRRKCDMYWPSGGRGSSADFGGVHVTLLHEDVRAAYTVRTMRVRTAANKDSDSPPEERIISQFHYTVWPDHGTPRHPLQVLPLVRAAAAAPRTVLVHCSAGVGRTGTYIVLDAQLNQLKLTGTLSPLGFLCRARTQRNHLVQTEEQYIFVHDALLEHVRSGNTEVEPEKARDYLVKLLQPITEEELAVLDLNPVKNKSVNDLTNGFDHAETSSLKSSKIESERTDLPNGDGSQLSMKTDDLSESKSESVKENGDGESTSQEERGEGMVNGNGDDSEGVYDLAPRATDTYSKKMAAYNNLSEQEKEEIRRANRAENYAILERMRSLSNRTQQFEGPPPCNLLEKQYLLISRSCVEPSICARAAHNVDKNRPGSMLPSDAARVMLVPKPGVEGSEYINASWVCGRRRLREFAVAQHPLPSASVDLWRLLWDHTAQLVLVLWDDDPSWASVDLWRLLWDHTAQLVLVLWDDDPSWASVDLWRLLWDHTAQLVLVLWDDDPFAVAQHPLPSASVDLWRLLWDHTAQLVLVLWDDDPVSVMCVDVDLGIMCKAVVLKGSDCIHLHICHGSWASVDLWRLLWDHTAQLVLVLWDDYPDCEIFWPTEDEKELFIANFRASFVSKDTYVAHRKSDRKSPVVTPEPEKPEMNGHRRSESGDCNDDERLIPENSSPILDSEPAYRFDRTELRLERLSSGSKDLSARKSIANGDLFSSLGVSSGWFPPDTAPPPPPVAPALTVEEETELRRPVYMFEKVTSIPEDVPLDRIIEVTNVSVHSLQDDYQLSVKFMRCSGWLEGETTAYTLGHPEENEYIRGVMEAKSEEERGEALDRLTEPYKDSFALVEFVAGCQMEYKNGPVVVVDKNGDWKAMSFCSLSEACGALSATEPADIYRYCALGAHARCARARKAVVAPSALLAQYAALATYHANT
ncbi:unnamed protein product [Plutella xylostella]|uniref:(diamondback moth) hypothetical protein n=1 Tax=Plutella xylostella TaxID=51655 RepID=A0A8S4E3G8_PLUXY|nr:unnamed protein product [Plutella xylostella]